MPDTNRTPPCPVCTAAAAAPPIDPAVSRQVQDLLPEGARIVHQLYLDQREHQLRECYAEIGRLDRELRGKGPHPQPRRRRDPKLHVIHHDVGIRCTSHHDGDGSCIKCCCGEWVRPEAFEEHLEEGARPPGLLLVSGRRLRQYEDTERIALRRKGEEAPGAAA